MAWTWFAGKDLNWDFMNYHFYGPYELLEGRLAVDYFAANVQGFLNPTGFVPLFWMIEAGWHPLVIGAALALVHSLNFAFIWAIAERMIPRDYPFRTAASVCSVALAFLAPLQLTMLGGTPLDPITSLPALAAICLLIKPREHVGMQHALAVGLMAGVAAGLKLTNLLLLPALAIAIEVANGHLELRKSTLRLMSYGAGVAMGMCVSHGYWSLELWKETGNPVFPLLNNLFQSPDFPGQTFQDRRYLEGPWWRVITLPLDMLSHRSGVYAENVVADPRPLAFLVALALLLVQFLARARVAQKSSLKDPSDAAFRTVLIFAAVFYLTWAESSRIGRYALVLWLLVGPLTIAALVRLQWRIIALTVFAASVGVQILFLHSNGNPRWTAAEWGSKWLDVEIPKSLREIPAAYLTIGPLTYSAVIPFFDSDARFANIVGQYVQPAGARMTPHLREFLASSLPLKVIFSASAKGNPISAAQTKDINAMLSIYGYQLAGHECEDVVIKMNRLTGFNWDKAAIRLGVKRFAVCDVIATTPSDKLVTRERVAEIDRVFDAVEDSCPSLFAPRRGQTVPTVRGWMRVYFNTNMQLITDGVDVAVRPAQSITDIIVGSLDDWQSVKNPLPCTRFADGLFVLSKRVPS